MRRNVDRTEHPATIPRILFRQDAVVEEGLLASAMCVQRDRCKRSLACAVSFQSQTPIRTLYLVVVTCSHCVADTPIVYGSAGSPAFVLLKCCIECWIEFNYGRGENCSLQGPRVRTRTLFPQANENLFLKRTNRNNKSKCTPLTTNLSKYNHHILILYI
jgi:hypothetical protein